MPQTGRGFATPISTDTTSRRGRRSPKLPDGVSLSRLCDAVVRDRRELQPFRENRKEAVRQYCGALYGENAAGAEVPVNLLGLYVETVVNAVIDAAPRVMLSTFDEAMRATVSAMQAWVNDQFVVMRVAETYQRILTDALFWVGIGKVAIATPADAEAEAWDVEAGQPFLEAIDPDDAVWDTTGRRYSRCKYQGCRYTVPTDLANELYRKGRQAKFEAADPTDVNDGGDDRIYTVGTAGGRHERVEDETVFWELFLPRHKVVVTLLDRDGQPDGDEPVRVQPWVGPSCGPYHFLSLGTVPGNLEPKAPIMDLVSPHRHFNRNYRKLLNRAANSKRLTIFTGRSTELAERVRKASDLDMVQGDDVSGLHEWESGGPTNDLVVMCDHIKSMFSFRGGNLEILRGLSPEARTAAQSKMMNDNAGAGIGAIANASHAFIERTCTSLIWYYHYHPTKVMESHYNAPMLPEYQIVRRVTPQMRGGTPPRVKIDPYSLGRQTPQSRLAFITQTLTTLAPLMALAAQQGKIPNMDEVLGLMAKYGNEPDLTRIFNLTVPPQADNAGTTGPGDGAGKPAQTERTYNRISSGGQGPQADQQRLDVDVSKMQGPANPNSGGYQ